MAFAEPYHYHTRAACRRSTELSLSAARRILRAGWIPLLLGAAWPVQAQDWPTLAPIPLEGDASRGKTLAYTCTGCHGVPGYRHTYPAYHVPKLAGQNADYVEIALQAYRRGSRFHQTMRAQAAGLSDQDIADIAAYFAEQQVSPETGRSAARAERIDAGERRASACVPCHGEAGRAQSDQWPHLAGQHASYLEQAMKQYRQGARSESVMAPLVEPLDDEALADLAAFYAAQPGLATIGETIDDD